MMAGHDDAGMSYSCEGSWVPAANIYRQADRILVCVDLAGMQRKDIDVQVAPGVLTVRGDRPTPHLPTTNRQVDHIANMEIESGRFCRQLPIPKNVQLDGVSSTYRDGMLWIQLPIRRR